MKLGILCGGGPAPGMNSVISAATIEARNSGWDVLGIMDGFQHLIEGRVEEARPLSITDVSRIHVQGGSVIRTSRANPTVRDEGAADPDWRLHACLESLRKLGIDALVTIGGDDTAFSASRLAEAAGGGLRVAHVPKTIDNDLPLPGGAPTFGFETARSVGVELVNNLMTDAITTQRWYLVVAMGRSAGHLALGIGKSAGATLTMIAEEFPRDEPIRLSRLVDVLETSMLKRIAHGRPFGVAVLAEGIGLRLPQDELAPGHAGGRAGRARPRPAGRARAGPPAGQAGQGPLQGARAERHGRGQEHRLRAPLRAAHPVRHRVHPRPGLRRRRLPQAGAGRATSPAA